MVFIDLQKVYDGIPNVNKNKNITIISLYNYNVYVIPQPTGIELM